jgi:hypothetical protein
VHGSRSHAELIGPLSGYVFLEPHAGPALQGRLQKFLPLPSNKEVGVMPTVGVKAQSSA